MTKDETEIIKIPLQLTVRDLAGRLALLQRPSRIGLVAQPRDGRQRMEHEPV